MNKKRKPRPRPGLLCSDSNPDFTVPLGYGGGLPDRHIGLIRFGFRDDDPDVGRWTAKDPIGYAGGDNDLYGYCLDDPINGVDPEGLFVGAIAGVAPVAGSPLAPILIGATGLGLAGYGLYKTGEWLFKDDDETPKKIQEGIETPQKDDLLDPYHINPGIDDTLLPDPNTVEEEHRKKGTTGEANRNKHEEGKARKKRDKQGGEKGDARRPYRR